MSSFGVVAGVVGLFFVAGILTGVLGVMALSAMRGHRARGERRRNFGDYDLGRNPGQGDDLPPPWPGRRG